MTFRRTRLNIYHSDLVVTVAGVNHVTTDFVASPGHFGIMTNQKTIKRRAFEDLGLGAGEIRHLKRAFANTICGLTDRQIKLSADRLFNYLKSRQVIFDLSPDVLECEKADVPDLRALAEGMLGRPPRATPLDRRLGWIGALLGLSPIERTILGVMARRSVFQSWRELLDILPFSSSSPNALILAVTTGLRISDVDQCLTPDAALLSCHLLHDQRDGEFEASRLLQRVARSHSKTAKEMMKWLAPQARPSTLELQDFSHLGDLVELARRVLAGNEPISILLYGEPGTGKTELALALAESLGKGAVFAGLADNKGFEPHRYERLEHLALLRAVCGKGRERLIVVDEADDVLCLGSRKESSKLWLNRAIEQPGVSTIWVLNDARNLDPAMLRRMTLAIGFDRPNRIIRERMTRKAAATYGISLHDKDVCELAALPVNPSLLANGMRVAALTGGGASEAKRAINSVMEVLSSRPVRLETASDIYDAAISNADQDLDAIAAKLAAAPDNGWNLLLTGPSGTGKTAYARHLASLVGMEVEECRGSDLLSPFVGESEACIAKAFAKAEARKALLLIDEVDSFMFDRNQSERSWEVGLVNEMLRQMEGRGTPFIATTNRLQALDPAVQRRFTMRINFQAMRPDQAKTLFRAQFLHDWPGAELVPVDLTPGDFALVAKRAKLLDEVRPSVIVRWLRDEVSARNGGGKHRLGFAA